MTKKWLLKNVGKKCSSYCWDCFVCRSWRLFEEIEAYKEYIKILDRIDLKKARPHRK